jgi:hypothetical protein
MSHAIGIYVLHAIIHALIYSTVWEMVKGQPLWVDVAMGATAVFVLYLLTRRRRYY